MPIVKGSLILGLLFSLLWDPGHSIVAAALSNATQTSVELQSSSTSSSPLPLSSQPGSGALTAQEVAQQSQPQAGNDYGLGPLGILASTNDQGHGGGEAQAQEAKQTLASKTPDTTSGGETSKSASITTKSGNSSKTEPTTFAKVTSVFAQAGPSHSENFAFPASTTISPGPTPSHAYEGSDSDTFSSSGTRDSWKVIGIGVLAFVGIVLLVLGTAFHDALLRTFTRRFRRRKEDEEVFVPDWHRGSWRFGADGVSIEKPSFGENGDEVPRISEEEKGKLAIPLPPISPFPLRRSASTTSRPPVEPGIAGVGAGSVAIAKMHNNNHSILPSSPPMHAHGRAQEKRKSRRKSKVNPFETPRDHCSDNDAYGGME